MTNLRSAYDSLISYLVRYWRQVHEDLRRTESESAYTRGIATLLVGTLTMIGLLRYDHLFAAGVVWWAFFHHAVVRVVWGLVAASDNRMASSMVSLPDNYDPDGYSRCLEARERLFKLVDARDADGLVAGWLDGSLPRWLLPGSGESTVMTSPVIRMLHDLVNSLYDEALETEQVYEGRHQWALKAAARAADFMGRGLRDEARSWLTLSLWGRLIAWEGRMVMEDLDTRERSGVWENWYGSGLPPVSYTSPSVVGRGPEARVVRGVAGGAFKDAAFLAEVLAANYDVLYPQGWQAVAQSVD